MAQNKKYDKKEMTIIGYIKANIDEDFKEKLPFKISCKTVKKGYILTDFGQMESKVYFINKG